VGTATDGAELVELFERHRPDVVLTDQSMPKLSGLEATRAIVAIDPDAKVVVLSAFDDQALVVAALDAGARGYLVKSITGPELVRKLRAVFSGEYGLDRSATERLVRELRTTRAQTATGDRVDGALSGREIDVLALVADGLSNPQIAERLGISAQTVKTYLDRVFAKLGVSDRTAAVRRALQQGVIA
jgi:DNA-binding NarL/FixJ family response regulator